ncbi:MAG TPA: alpha/beta fold hydrolase [Candidatus Deferrimicrobium sp.]|nr:alpha/beta fold hydrolase [Candidatus Deferrimicrobium sp.]
MGIDVVKLREEFQDSHYLINTSDGKVLFLRAWEPKTQKKNVAVLFFHGITGHSGAYSMVGESAAAAGFSVFGLDLRGHGLSDGVRGDYPSKKRLIEDIKETIAFLKNKFPKLVGVGHSLGNLVLIEALNNCREDINGLVFLSLGRTIKPDAYPKLSIGKKLKMLYYIIFRYPKPKISYEREGQVGKDDPLFNFKYSARFLNILNASKFVKKFKFADKLDLPAYVGISEHDELFSIETARAFYDEIPSETKEFYVIPGAKHAEYPAGSWDHLVNWLKKNF